MRRLASFYGNLAIMLLNTAVFSREIAERIAVWMGESGRGLCGAGAAGSR